MVGRDTIDRAVVGTCPECGQDVPARLTLIAYRREGQRACYAECGACRAVVHPE